MTARAVLVLATAFAGVALGALGGCGRSPWHPADQIGGLPAAPLGYARDDAGNARDPVADAAPSATIAATPDAGPIRMLTARPILATPVNNLLMDPFITTDRSWGHFVPVIPASDPTQTRGDCNGLAFVILSDSPVGVSAPAVLVDADTMPSISGCTAIVAPFVGSTEPVGARIWASLDDASGAPLPFPAPSDGGTSAIDAVLTVALVANAVPASAASVSYPLTAVDQAPTVVGARSWGALALPALASLGEGGWFAITLTNGTRGVYLAAPEVVPGGTSTELVLRPATGWSRPASDAERGAIQQYPRHAPRRRPPRRHAPARRSGAP
jgi:hypothetical protein